MDRVRVVGGGLAGVEAARFLAARGIPVDLYEMRPRIMTPAHKTDLLAELVCSNSFKGTDPFTAHGILKREMLELGSLVLSMALETRVPAGKALAVDRAAFSSAMTRRIATDPLITLYREEFTKLDDEILTIIASGPLTSNALADNLAGITGRHRLFFYDAISPIVDADSIDREYAFYAARWTEGNDDYLNCPLSAEEYHRFLEELLRADRVKAHSFEDASYFESCLPIEVVAGRGRDALRFGAMRPVGLIDPATGKRPYAVVQLRRENLKGNAYTIVGFQTRLTFTEQERVIRLIPALRQARFLRFGSIHRNTYLDSPKILQKDLSLKNRPNIFLAGQITGVEGYTESAATGILAGISVLARLKGKVLALPGADTAYGALVQYITSGGPDPFQPSNINFGIMEMVEASKSRRNELRSERAALSFARWKQELQELL
jgi:methylenetetrahydrofolate--tRNA-(uracil-5-)-methyltransferase